uniref:Uncharacterized protein n=1 Tax=Anguilla anguilla TaxID=7936 RepID=A0A0E9R835_ANGAN
MWTNYLISLRQINFISFFR